MNFAKSVLKEAARRTKRLLPSPTRPAILMYHRIDNDRFDPWGLCVDKARFSSQVEWLSKNRTVLPLDEFARRQREGTLEPSATALTFDDGYASVLEAVPILERFGIQATVFLPVEVIKDRRGFWWDDLARAVIHSSSAIVHLGGNEILLPSSDPRDALWPPHKPPRTARQKLFHSLWAELRIQQPAEIQSRLSALEASPRNKIDRPLLPDEIRSIPAQTLEFGSHALSHPHLPALPEREKVREIRDSLEECASLTGRKPSSFCYPYGDVDPSSVQIARDAGFSCACATGNDFVSSRSDPFALPRQYVGDWEPGRLADMLGAG